MGLDRATVLSARLAELGPPWSGPLTCLDSTSSTSEVLKNLPGDRLRHWSVVWADEQTAGHGRRGRGWFSPPGNMYFSFAVRPSAPLASPGLLPLAVGVALAEALEFFGLAPDLKWPNDLVVHGRKLGGILCEAVSTGGELERIIVGVGVNLNADLEGLPEDVREIATSMCAETGRTVAPLEAVARSLARIRVWYDALALPDPARVRAAWTRRAVAWWGQPIEARTPTGPVRGVARGIDETGALQIEREDGERTSLVSAETWGARLR